MQKLCEIDKKMQIVMQNWSKDAKSDAKLIKGCKNWCEIDQRMQKIMQNWSKDAKNDAKLIKRCKKWCKIDQKMQKRSKISKLTQNTLND